MSTSRLSNSKRNIIYGLINKIVLLIVPFIIRTIIIKTLGAEYLGLTSLFTSILQVLNLTELGFSSAVVFCMYKPIAENDTDTICALMNMFRKVYKIIGIFILIVGIAISPILPHLIKGSYPEDINIYILYFIYLLNTVISYLLFAYKSALLIAHQRNDIEVNITTVTFGVQYGIQIITLIIFKNFYAYAATFLLSTLIGNIARAIITNKKYPQYTCMGNLEKTQVEDIKKRVMGAFIQKICATTRNSFDSIFLSMFLGLTTITIYGNYYYVLTAVHGVLTVIITAVTASVGDSIARESVEKNLHDMKKFSFMYAWVGGFCTVCMLCLYQPFMRLWVGEQLMFPLSTVILFCCYFYSLTIGDVRYIYTTGSGLWWEGRYRSIAETCTNIVLNWTLGKYFGANGIIVATLISIVFINFLWSTQILFKYYFKGKKPAGFYFEHIYYAIVTASVCLITFTIVSFVSFEGFFGLIVRAMITIVIGNALFWLAYRKNKYFKEAFEIAKQLIRVKSYH